MNIKQIWQVFLILLKISRFSTLIIGEKYKAINSIPLKSHPKNSETAPKDIF